ncbi:MAG: hypothetical protein HY897_08995 [Deltaproteobacteria bacterium]|nr:hypothetical protein [Deltaproteobacteria bacterium]
MTPGTKTLALVAALAFACTDATTDEGTRDEGTAQDAGAGDDGEFADRVPGMDAGSDSSDASHPSDASSDASETGDGGREEAGTRDEGATDDGGSRDEGTRDAETPDAGPPKEDDSEVVSADLPGTLACGASHQGSVTMRNTGTATWTRLAGYKLGALGDADPFISGDPRVWLPEGVSVAPGGTYEFPVTLTAPGSPGTYTTDWQMVHESAHWFGATAKKDVQVQCAAGVDASTMEKKLLMGYQGWFYAPGDGSPINHWVHWFRSPSDPSAQNATFDLWPDLSELDADELYATNMTMPAGGAARLYSAWTQKTVVRHFGWMEDNGIDGVLLQRFASELRDPRFLTARDQVTRNVRAGAEAHGRVFAIEYDISGMNEANIPDDLKNDWRHLVDDLGVTQSPRYLRHKGKPVLFVWGFGFDDRPGTPAQASDLIGWFKSGAGANYQVTLAGGVPTHWRALTGDSKTDPAWLPVYRSYDIINPWAVGRYADDKGADDFKKNQIAPDLADAKAHGVEYMPVIFPGFSWHNLFPQNPPNQIPRRGGRFYWRQAYNAVSAGTTMIFSAMFDEVDEGTAMMKAAPTQNDVPNEGTFLSLDADGEALPNDWYLRLAGEASKMLRGEIPASTTMPISP